MKKFFIHNAAEPLGPFTVDELKDMEITRYTPVWCEGMTDWTPAAQVEELESLWSDSHSFVHYPSAPPAFDKTAYDKALQTVNDSRTTAPSRRNIGQMVFWTCFGLLAAGIVVLAAYQFHLNRMDKTYATAVEQKRWEDSVTKAMDTTRVNAYDGLGAGSDDTTLVDAETEFSRTQRKNLADYTRMNIERFVRAAKSYDTKKLGGIRNGRLVFYNNSNFTINRADFIVAYVKANGEVYERKNLSLTNVPPHGKRELKIPDEKRGAEVQCMLTKISSAELGIAKNVRIAF